MTIQKSNHHLPQEIYDRFRAVDRAGDSDSRDDLIRALRAAKWTLASIADAAVLTRERVRQIAATPTPNNLPEVPEPPQKPVKAAREFIEPDPDVLARMLELKPLAEKVRANSPAYREEAEEYNRLLADQHQRKGVTLYRLALRLGCEHATLRGRLARYGYKKPPQGGSSRLYKVVDKANRAL